jgi:hypothetical protein
MNPRIFNGSWVEETELNLPTHSVCFLQTNSVPIDTPIPTGVWVDKYTENALGETIVQHVFFNGVDRDLISGGFHTFLEGAQNGTATWVRLELVHEAEW